MKYKLNISIDDVSPHPRSSTKVLDRCYELIDDFPEIKFSLFIPMAYWRTGRRGTTTSGPLFVSKDPEFCKIIKELPSENFELGYHGFFHGKPNEKIDNDELYNINKKQADRIFSKMIQEARRAKIDKCFKPMIRPPNWKMSPICFDVANDMGINLFALTNIKNRIEGYGDSINKYNCVYSDYSPPNRNMDLLDNEEQIIKTHEDNGINRDDIVVNCGVVFHACEWLKNYLDIENTDVIRKFVNKHKEKVEFCFLEDLL